MNISINNIRFGAFLLAIFVLAAFAVAPAVIHAADIGDYGGWSGGDWGGYDYGGWSGGDWGGYDYGGWSGGDYGYEYGYNNWSPSSFGGFGGFGGGGFVNAPTSNLVTNNGNTYTYAPQNINTCTATNSCNNNSVINAPTTVTVSGGGGSYPVYYSQPYPVYPSYPYPVPSVSTQTGCGYTSVCPTTTYRAPYVSLSAAPYTGLELGPVGTVLYWGFLVLWVLLAAYLIAVKKIQNKIVAGLNGFLFPAPTGPALASHGVIATAHAPKANRHAAEGTVEEGIDPFIASQVHRAR